MGRETMAVNLSEILSGKRAPGLPKYLQLEEAILKAIDDGSYKPGDQLPPDVDIVRDTRFSLGTVQSAMRSLAKRGAVVRDQGRGTFVAQKRTVELEQPWYARFTREEKQEEFLPIFPKVVFCRRVKGEERLRRVFPGAADDYVQIDRRIKVGNEFSLYDRFFLPANEFGGFLSKNREELERTNFKIFLRREYRVEIRRLARTMRLTELPKTVCRKIRVPAGTVGLINQSTAYSQKDNPVFFQESYVPPNPLLLHMPDSVSIPDDWV
jgi:GntR family transcriptional regulator